MPAPRTNPFIPPSPPPHIAVRLPGPALLRQALLACTCTVPAGQVLARVSATYRFGPPAGFRHDGDFPFHWVYAAADAMTAVWEARLCLNDVTDPGTFYLAPVRSSTRWHTGGDWAPSDARTLRSTGAGITRIGPW